MEMLNTKTPRYFDYDIDFWTTSILGKVIKLKYNVLYKSRTPIQLIFKEAKFTYHKPDKQYKNRNQEAIDVWKKEKIPVIKKLMEDLQNIVLAEDELILTTQTTFQKIWLPQGFFPMHRSLILRNTFGRLLVPMLRTINL